MLYPQTTAKSIYKNCENISKFGCLAMCYLYACNFRGTQDTDYIRKVSDAIDEKILDKECTVLDAQKFILWATGKKSSVSKKNVNDISEIKDKTPVAYEYNGNKHWVVVENGKIVFNSLLNSVCVTKGKPTEKRVIKFA